MCNISVLTSAVSQGVGAFICNWALLGDTMSMVQEDAACACSLYKGCLPRQSKWDCSTLQLQPSAMINSRNVNGACSYTVLPSGQVVVHLRSGHGCASGRLH